MYDKFVAHEGMVNIAMSTKWSPYTKNWVLYIELLKQPSLLAFRHERSPVKLKNVGKLPSILTLILNGDLITL